MESYTDDNWGMPDDGTIYESSGGNLFDAAFCTVLNSEISEVPELSEEQSAEDILETIPSHSDENTLCKGIFINDKSYNEHKAQEYFQKEVIERKSAADAIDRGDVSAAKRHEAAANSNHKLAVDYQNMAKKSTK